MTPQDLTFDSHGITCRGYFYTGQGNGPSPCIIMGHGFAATRDCGLAPFAEAFVAVAWSPWRRRGMAGCRPLLPSAR